MDFLKLYTWRKFAGLLGTLIICLVLALLGDGMIAGGRKDPKLYDLIPGQTLSLSELMPRGTEKLEDLSPRISEPKISLRLIETFSGFWLGGTLWRAEVTLPKDTPLGEHSVAIYYHNGTKPNPTQDFRLLVHKDEASVQQAALSLCMRLTGVSPYLVAVLLLPMVLGPMWACMFLSRKIAQSLREKGMAEIYRAMASPEGQRIFFTLPQGRSLAEADQVDVLDERGQRLQGTALVHKITKHDVEAIMQAEVKIRPGSLAKVS